VVKEGELGFFTSLKPRTSISVDAVISLVPGAAKVAGINSFAVINILYVPAIKLVAGGKISSFRVPAVEVPEFA